MLDIRWAIVPGISKLGQQAINPSWLLLAQGHEGLPADKAKGGPLRKLEPWQQAEDQITQNLQGERAA